jgi:hypothetical protein
MRHVLGGPAFFRANLDPQDVCSEINGWTPSEKTLPLEADGLPVRGPRSGRGGACGSLTSNAPVAATRMPPGIELASMPPKPSSAGRNRHLFPRP